MRSNPNFFQEDFNKNLLKISLSQLVLVESFVEDLLNLTLLREGVFKLENGPFNLKETLDFVVNIFRMKKQTHDIDISHNFNEEIENTLEIGSRHTNQNILISTTS